jgi:hypothetical protein
VPEGAGVTTHQLLLLIPLVTIVAFFYSAVGQAGASGYIAVMALVGVAPEVIKPTALLLNVGVALIACYQFWRAGHFSWRLFWPFAFPSVPAAFLGGYLALPTRGFKIVVGLVLLYSAARFILKPRDETNVVLPKLGAALPVGAGLGLLAGLTGTGGGIFLTPLAILMRWATTKTAAAVSAAFILVNSISGLAGNLSATRQFPGLAAPLVVATLAAGAVGSHLGSRRFPPEVVTRFLAVMLMIAGMKLILTA